MIRWNFLLCNKEQEQCVLGGDFRGYSTHGMYSAFVANPKPQQSINQQLYSVSMDGPSSLEHLI